jgi:VanZ family protein
MKKNFTNLLLQILAFLLPFYFIFYGPLHDNPERPKVKTLWKYIFSGFFTYMILGIIFVLIKKEIL